MIEIKMPTGKQQPCEDAISRQRVLEIINFEDNWLFDAKSHNTDTQTAFSTIKLKISELPSIQPTRPKGEDEYKKGYSDGFRDCLDKNV